MREARRWIARLLGWRDAWWTKTIRYAHTPAETKSHGGFTGGHRRLGKHGWDNTIQRAADERREEPWQEVAQNRQELMRLKAAFIARVLRVCVAVDLPCTWHLLLKNQCEFGTLRSRRSACHTRAARAA